MNEMNELNTLKINRLNMRMSGHIHRQNVKHRTQAVSNSKGIISEKLIDLLDSTYYKLLIFRKQ